MGIYLLESGSVIGLRSRCGGTGHGNHFQAADAGGDSRRRSRPPPRDDSFPDATASSQESMGGMSEDSFFDAVRLGSDYLHHAASAGSECGRVLRSAAGNSGLSRKPADCQRPLAGVLRSSARSVNNPTTRYRFVTPKGQLTMTLACDPYTAWVVEPLIKEKRDIDLIGEFVTAPMCDVEAVNRRLRRVRRAGAGARVHLLLRRLRPAGHLAGRHLPGRHRAADHGNLRRSRLGPRPSRHPAAAQGDLHPTPWPARVTTSWNWAEAAPPPP